MGTSQRIEFCDIPNDLASVRISAKGDKIEELVAYPGVVARLESKRRKGIRLGIRADPGRIRPEHVLDRLERAGLLGYFDLRLIFLEPKNIPAPFEIAFEKTFAAMSEDGNPPQMLFVSADASERVRALSAGMLASPHWRVADAVHGEGEGPSLRFLRIRIPPELARADWRGLLSRLPVAPLHVSIGGLEAASPAVYMVAGGDTAAVLDEYGFWVDRLGSEGEPQRSDLYLLADHRRQSLGGRKGHITSFFARAQEVGNVLASTNEGLFVAVDSGARDVAGMLHDLHRYGRKLIPSVTLLEAGYVVDTSPSRGVGIVKGNSRILTAEERCAIRKAVKPETMQTDADRYSGAVPVHGDQTIDSRNMMHPHNELAVCALAADLVRLGGGRLNVGLHPFTHEGVQCANVEAVLPKSGLGGVVIVCAHLDSTADLREPGSPPYDARKDPAPGKDDNASGIAGVLCVARALLDLARTKVNRREIRFVLFNAEEYSVTGSGVYARDRKRMRDDIVAVFNMDMIGYDAVTPSNFELHAGGNGTAAVMACSRDLAKLVAEVAREVSERALLPQFHWGLDGSDTASGHSDHSSFHENGFPACLITEDFSRDSGPDAPEPDTTPGYHRCTDTVVHPAYAADIARAVAAAAWVAATRVD
jgi:hypothetical protein